MRLMPPIFILLFLAATGGHSLSARADGASIRTLGKYSRIEIPALPSTAVTATGGGEKIQLRLERSQDLSRVDTAALTDSRVREVKIRADRPGEALVDIRLKGPGADFFAWAQADPPAIVVDVWEVAPAPRKLAAAKPAVKREVSREPASRPETPEETVVEPITREGSVIPKFVVPMPALVLQGGKVEVPSRLNVEDHWAFNPGRSSIPDDEAFNFALKLYGEKKFGLALRTVDLLERDHPATKHRHELRLLRAFALKKLSEEQKAPILLEQADKILQELVVTKDDAGRALPFQKTLLTYFTMKEYQAGVPLRAAEMVEALIRVTDVADPEYLKLQMILADLYVKLRRPRAAERIFRYIEEKHGSHPLAAEAAYRTADLLATEGNYVRVVEEGDKALKKYPAHRKARP
ncbi:MAG: tetratricopeptide repeat protein, partial [Bdellovibrionales bacterium]|nr:tetratricopeptide repeat protein [Bdellovibrionales bacterium]